MSTEPKSNITSLSVEKFSALAEQSGWSLVFAEGYISGQVERRRGGPLSSYLKVGVDEYALGFRAGYFGRAIPDRFALENPVVFTKSATESLAAN